MPDPDPRTTTDGLLAAIEAIGCRALISRGWAGLGEAALPEHVMVVGSVSHARLFPRVAAVVHHGGAGTTHTAARAGVPQVVVPHLLDQYYFARRVHDLGVAPPGDPAQTADRGAAGRDAAGGARQRAAGRPRRPARGRAGRVPPPRRTSPRCSRARASGHPEGVTDVAGLRERPTGI